MIEKTIGTLLSLFQCHRALGDELLQVVCVALHHAHHVVDKTIGFAALVCGVLIADFNAPSAQVWS